VARCPLTCSSSPPPRSRKPRSRTAHGLRPSSRSTTFLSSLRGERWPLSSAVGIRG
jgi:hypothetical protein